MQGGKGVFLPITEENVLKQVDAAPGRALAFPELLEMFGLRVELLALLFSMRKDYDCPLWFNDGWLDVTQLVVTTVEPEMPDGFRELKRPGRKARARPG